MPSNTEEKRELGKSDFKLWYANDRVCLVAGVGVIMSRAMAR